MLLAVTLCSFCTLGATATTGGELDTATEDTGDLCVKKNGDIRYPQTAS